MSCKFCEEFEWARQLRRKYPGGPDVYTTYHACFCEKTRRKGGGVIGVYTHRARPLKYCPECGRKLNGRKKKEKPTIDSQDVLHKCEDYNERGEEE